MTPFFLNLPPIAWLLGIAFACLLAFIFGHRLGQQRNSSTVYLNQTKALNQISNTLIHQTDQTATLQAILQQISVVIPNREANVVILNETADQVANVVYREGSVVRLKEQLFDLETINVGLSGWAMRNRQTAISPKGDHDQRETLALYKQRVTHDTGAIIVSPLLYQQQLVGTITLSRSMSAPNFSEQDVATIETLGTQIASAIINQTAIQSAEMALARAEALIEYAPDAILILDMDQKKFIEANPAASALFGHSVEYLKAMDPLAFYAPSEHEHILESRQLAFEKTLELGQYTVERQLINAAGETFAAEIRLALIPNTNKPLIRASIFDITERKQEEASEIQAQKLDSLGVMAGGIAHDFNNLLLAMLGQSQIVRRKLGEEHKAVKNLVKIEIAAQRAAELTRQMMAYAGNNQTAGALAAIDLNTMIIENATLLRASIPVNVHIHQDLTTATTQVLADKSQLQQVVMNMIINASDAIGTAVGDIWITTEHVVFDSIDAKRWQTIAPQLQTNTPYLCIKFRDNGCGMTPETLSRIFDPFFTTKKTGHGLGLAAVSGIIRSHGGSLRVSSEIDVGTTFEIVFPIATAVKETAPITATTTDVSRLAGRTILAIDDDDRVLDTVRQTLEQFQVTVLSATSGESGLEVFDARYGEIDLALVDVSMPGLNGVETMQSLRERCERTPVILTSGYNKHNANQMPHIAPNVLYLQKPYRTEQLLALLTQAFL